MLPIAYEPPLPYAIHPVPTGTDSPQDIWRRAPAFEALGLVSQALKIDI